MESKGFIEVTDFGGCKFSININYIVYVRPTGGGNSNIHLSTPEYILGRRKELVISIVENYSEIMEVISNAK